jgi:hypothetical protein
MMSGAPPHMGRPAHLVLNHASQRRIACRSCSGMGCPRRSLDHFDRRQTNQINNQYPSAVLDHQFFINGSPSRSKATTKKRFTYLTPQGGMSIATKPKYGFNAAQGSVLFPSASRGPQRGAIWITPRSPDDGSSLVHIFKTNSVFFILFYFFCFPFVMPRRSGRTGSISSALGDRWGGEYRSFLD